MIDGASEKGAQRTILTMLVSRSIEVPIRIGLSTEQLWKGEDNGLIASWEAGRKMSKTDKQLADRARDGELPTLGWKGGVAAETKTKTKYGTLRYLAMWQGLRGDDLMVDCNSETKLICSKTGVTVTYTPDASKYSTP